MEAKPREFLPPFDAKLDDHGMGPVRARSVTTLQVNVGKMCNQTCRHCHVDAGPHRTEIMDRETIDACIRAVAENDIPVVDITGGAPELNPHFDYFVTELKKVDTHIIDRCNLTIFSVEGKAYLPEFLRDHEIEIVASLPYYLEQNTDSQRGRGVFKQSIEALQRLNELGYGQEGTGLLLNLVFNPTGAYLPPAQEEMEAEYKRELKERHGIVFNSLYCITNMPISRFLEYLERSGNYDRYMNRLISAFNPAAAENVMCRDMLSVGWDGTLYDCDFNQMLEMQTDPSMPQSIFEFDLKKLRNRPVCTDTHCFGCTAGAGSSCGGEVVHGKEA